ncbi:MAG: GNAT family N-acetyltransferase, partial [Candidatus Omnitrophica bacterium]|nr:GNAT family N-acetyltransferase [Candidatus Omnitrophota bacterium]
DNDPENFERVLQRNPGTCWVIEEGDEILAAALGLYDGRRGFVQSVVVRRDRRNRGLGAEVVRKTVESLRACGTDRIRLFVRKENTDVLGFYEKLGFIVEDGCDYLYDSSGTPV